MLGVYGPWKEREPDCEGFGRKVKDLNFILPLIGNRLKARFDIVFLILYNQTLAKQCATKCEPWANLMLLCVRQFQVIISDDLK